MFLTMNGRRNTVFFLAFLMFAIILSGCSSGAKNPSGLFGETRETKVIFAEWKIDPKTGYKSTVSVATLGKERKTLFKHDGQVDGLSTSPDGKKFVFTVDGRQLYLSDINGKNRQLIDSLIQGWPRWSPDGSQIAYIGLDRSSENSKSVLVVYGANDRSKKIIPLEKYSFSPCAVLDWYPDNKNVAVYAKGADLTSSSLVKVDTAKHKLHDIAKNAQLRGITVEGDLNIVRVATDKDTADANAKWELWQGKAGNDLKKLFKDRLASNFATLSPDGKRVAYSKIDKKYGTQLFIADHNGKNEKRITELKEYIQFMPFWAPDKQSVVFSAVKQSGSDAGPYLYYYNEGTGKVNPVIKGKARPMHLGLIIAVYK